MQFAGAIRKQLLQIFTEKLLPQLRTRAAPQVLVAKFPLEPPLRVSVRELDFSPLQEKELSEEFPYGRRWPDEKMGAMRFPALSCIVEGEADIRIGITDRMLRNTPHSKDQCGGYVCSLPALSFLMVPSGTPSSSGGQLLWERPEPRSERLTILHLRLLPTGALCHPTVIEGETHHSQYSLLIEDPHLAPAFNILLDEALLKDGFRDDLLRAQLLVLLSRVHRKLASSQPQMTDGIHSRFTLHPPTEPDGAVRATVVEAASSFIQMHLHEPLTPETIAKSVGLKSARLNRLFRQHLSTSVMKYVVQQRHQAARRLLETSELSVQEISSLVGYKHLSHFSRAFRQDTGVSPLQFRRQIHIGH